MAAEVMGIIQGPYAGSSRDLRPGGLSFQPSYTPHGGKRSSAPLLIYKDDHGRFTDLGRILRDIQGGDHGRAQT
jgi:homogentisate 1,2-dioxygenase